MGYFHQFDSLYFNYSWHAAQRSTQRGIDKDMVAHAFRYGYRFHHHGAIYYRIGRKEIKRYSAICPDLKKMNGIHVVTSLNGKILTLFRNKTFKRIGTNKRKNTPTHAYWR